MSYCRFSSDNCASDVYAYESVLGGFQIHVAGRRVVGEVPKLPPFSKEKIDEYMAACEVQGAFLGACAYEDIMLPHAGESFVEPTAATCADRLLLLRALGYHVPQHAIDALREEAAGAQVPAHGKGERE